MAGWGALRGRSLEGVEEERMGAGAVSLLFVGGVLVVACAMAVIARKRVTIHAQPSSPFQALPTTTPTGAPTGAAGAAKQFKDLRTWFRENQVAGIKDGWLSDVEKFVEEFEALEQKCVQNEERNQELQQRVDSLEATLRKYPQTPVTTVSLGTTRETETPPTSDATDMDATPRHDETPDSDDETRPAASLRFLPPCPVPELAPLEPWEADSPREKGLRPTEKQRAAEAAGTFTPLFDEKGLQTPRTLMELVSSHRLTKESLQTRITRRKQQAAMQQTQLEYCQATLPAELARANAAVEALQKLAASPAENPAALEELLGFYGARIPDLAQRVTDQRVQAEEYLAFAYRVQARLDREMDIGRLDSVKHPAGVLMKAQGTRSAPVALGELRALPPHRELSSLAVNPYKVDSWPIEPNSRGCRASCDLAVPPLREYEEEDAPDSEPAESEPSEESGSDGDWMHLGPQMFDIERHEAPRLLDDDELPALSPDRAAPTELPPLALPDGSPKPSSDGSPEPGAKKVVRLPPLALGGAGSAIA